MDINLEEYVDVVKKQYDYLKMNGYSDTATFSIISLASNCYNADHLNKNVSANIGGLINDK